MSTQLVLYPQNYQGFSYGVPVQNFLVDGISFTSINLATSITGAYTYLSLLAAQPPATVNTWYKHREDAGVDYPTESGGNLIFDAVSGTPSDSTVYQRLSNLTVGKVYDVAIDLIADTSGAWFLIIVDGNTYSTLGGTIAGANITQITTQFTAATTEDILLLAWTDINTNTITVKNISVTQASLSPTGIYTELQDGQVICDLYQEEDIPLTLSIDDFKSVAEKVQSYSKDFNLPATKRNNQIFNNMFEVTRADDGLIFNPYVKTKCALKQDGFILFDGFLKLTDVKEKDGEISYNVHLYSDVIAFANVLEERTFSNLDFTELEHAYNFDNIEYSWNTIGTGITYTNPNTSGFRDAHDTVKYPFIDWNHQFSLSPSTGIPKLANLETAFRPCIQIKYLIDKIFADTQFTYSSNFFETDDFKNLYMDFNWGAGNAPTLQTQTTITSYYLKGASNTPADNFAGTSYSVMELSINTPLLSSFVPANYSSSSFILTSTQNNETYNIDYHFAIENTDTVEREVQCRWNHNGFPIDETPDIGGPNVIKIPAGETYLYEGIFDVLLSTIGETLSVEFKTDSGTASKIRQVPGNLMTSLGAICIWTEGSVNITSGSVLDTLRGDLGQWEFLKGLLTMFNLMTVADKENPTNIIIEPYPDLFIRNTNSNDISDLTLATRGIQHDWTDKVDVSEMELKPLDDLNKTTLFGFVEDDDDYTFNIYKKATFGNLYGSLKFDATTSSSNGLPTLLEGDEEIIAEPFAATVSKPLMPQFSDLIVPSLYAMADDGTCEGFDNSPRIFYNNGVKDLVVAGGYAVPAQNGVGIHVPTKFLQFSHMSDVPSVVSSPPATTDTRDFVFESSQLIGLGASPTNNLYRTYWQPYFGELYNSDTRIMTLKVNLNAADINTFNFTDTVIVKNRVFRVNKIEYKPNSLSKVEFILIP